jgi:hypothetical protein
MKGVLSGQSNFRVRVSVRCVRVIKCIVIIEKKMTKKDLWKATGLTNKL